jgi:hypothetical protein
MWLGFKPNPMFGYTPPIIESPDTHKGARTLSAAQPTRSFIPTPVELSQAVEEFLIRHKQTNGKSRR